MRKLFFKEHSNGVVAFVLAYVIAFVLLGILLIHQYQDGRLLQEQGFGHMLAAIGIFSLIPAVLAAMAEFRIRQSYLFEALNRLIYVVKYSLMVLLFAVISGVFTVYLLNMALSYGWNNDLLLFGCYLLFWIMTVGIFCFRLVLTLSLAPVGNVCMLALVVCLLLTVVTIEPAIQSVFHRVEELCSLIGIGMVPQKTEALFCGVCSLPLYCRMWNGIGRYFNMD